MKIKIEIGGNVKSFDIAENDVERFKQKFLDLADVDNFDYDEFCKFVAKILLVFQRQKLVMVITDYLIIRSKDNEKYIFRI